MILIDLVYNLALLAALSVISGFISDRQNKTWVASILQGILFGSVALIGMMRPLNLGPGLIFDGRSIMLSLCALFFGPLSVAIAGVMTISLRLYLGGNGAVTGVLVILSSCLIGLFFHFSYKKRTRELSSLFFWLFGFLVHIAMILLMFTLPKTVSLNTLRTITFPVLLTYPLATILIGKIISDSLARKKYLDELKISEKALRTSEVRLRSLLYTIPDLVWLKNTDGVYLFCNAQFERFFGAKEKEIIGKTDYHFVEKTMADFFCENDRKSIDSAKPTKNEEWINFADDGKRVLLETLKTPVYDDTGNIIGILGIGHDITERNATENKIRTLLAEKETLLIEVHHRIKNNMNTIKGLLTLQFATEKNHTVIASLKDAESRVQTLILLYDRLYCTNNYRELSVELYLKPLAEEIVGTFPNCGKIVLHTSIERFILSVQTLTTVGIIVNEILTNIMKHAFVGKENGCISFTVSLKNTKVVLIITDDGIGIPESVSLNTSDSFGLRLVQMIAEQLEASAVLESKNGTVFTLTFSI